MVASRIPVNFLGKTRYCDRDHSQETNRDMIMSC